MIKTIIFDNGGVIVEDQWLKFENDLYDKYGRNSGSIVETIKSYGKESTNGRLSFDGLIEHIRELTKTTDDFYALYHPKGSKKAVISFIKILGKDYELALLTNELSNFDRDNKVWKLEKYFGENIFQSSKMGFSKPDTRTFEYVLSTLGKKPSEAVFIDDKISNIEGARKVGMNVIQFISLEQLKKDLPVLIERSNGKK